jgi:PAS domain S-box-containing protein
MLAWTWWLGDYAGILVFAPALVGLSLRWRKQTVAEPFLWPFTSLIVGLALLAFSLIGAVEANRVVAWMSLLVGLTLAGSFVAYVSSRQQSEAAIARSEAEYRLIADNTADVIWILDADSQQFTYISPSVKKLRDYTPQEALTQSLREVLTPNSLTKAMALWPERLAAFAQDRAAVTHIDELDQVRKDGSIVRTEVSTPL